MKKTVATHTAVWKKRLFSLLLPGIRRLGKRIINNVITNSFIRVESETLRPRYSFIINVRVAEFSHSFV